MPFTEINGAHLYYELAGTGATTVTFLHAGIADQRMWDGQFEALAQQYRVLRYDLRGFGQTESEPMAFSHHDDLRALLDTLGIEQTVLVGCSNGGRVSMNFALAYPERAAALVMVCSSPGGYRYRGEAPALWSEIVSAFDAGDLKRVAALETQLWVVGPYRTPEQVDSKIHDLIFEADLVALEKEHVIENEQAFDPPAVERLGELQLPVLLVIGAVDSPVTLEAGKLMEAQITGARKVIFENAAHLPNLEYPDKFNAVVSEFLAGQA